MMCDGSLHHINFSSQQEDRSVLADLVDYQAGKFKVYVSVQFCRITVSRWLALHKDGTLLFQKQCGID